MNGVVYTLHAHHDLSLVALAAVLCLFGSWVVSKLYRHALNQPRRQALVWYLLTASTAGISIWCTHFIAILAYEPNAPIRFDLSLTFASLLIAIFGSTFGIMLAGLVRSTWATIAGGTLLGLSVSAMHYSGMMAYRVEGVVNWDSRYLLASVIIAVTLGIVALELGNRPGARSTTLMTLALASSIIGLHFTGMAAYQVSSVGNITQFSNPEEYRLLAVTIAATASIIVLGGLFANFIENRTRMESIDELRKARDTAESASRAKSEFMSILSHELRTPLTIIIGYAGFLSKLKDTTISKLKGNEKISEAHFNALGDQTQMHGSRISSAGAHLLTIVNDILDYTSIELNEIKLSKTEFNTDDIFTQIKEQFEGSASERNIVLNIDSKNFNLVADRSRCLQVIINLVGNALKFSKANNIYLRARKTNSSIIFEVEDDGCGIEKNDLDRIFLAFLQLGDPTTRTENGTGLGLAICKKLAVAHGGDVKVESTLGKGSKFTLVFPDIYICDSITLQAVAI